MSRFNVSRLFELPPQADLMDRNGWTLDHWDRYGFAGWDDGCASFFMNLLPSRLDGPAWAFGDRAAEIGSPFVLQQILRIVFDVDQAGVDEGWFAFKPGMAERLIRDRDTYFDRHPVAADAREAAEDLIAAFREEDASYRTDVAPRLLDEGWLLAHALAKPEEQLPTVRDAMVA